MSEKRLDAKNRWRNVVVAFRMSPEEAQELNVKVSLSGLSKQDYIIQCLLKHEIRVVGGMKVAKKVQAHLDDRTPCGRVNLTEREACERVCDFEAVENCMTEKEAKQEASRCLRCDHFGYGIFKGGRETLW